MGEKIDLTNGAWAHLRDPDDVPEKLRRPIQIATMRLSPEARTLLDTNEDDEGAPSTSELARELSAEDMEVLFDINDRLICALVDEWSFDLPIPPTPDAIGSLRAGDYDKLMEATATFATELMPTDFGPDGVVDPDSPTTPSSD